MSGLTLTEDLIKEWTGKNLKDLRTLDVSGSKIKRITMETLQGMHRLTKVNLSNNSLRRIVTNSSESVCMSAGGDDKLENQSCGGKKNENVSNKMEGVSDSAVIESFEMEVDSSSDDEKLEKKNLTVFLPDLLELNVSDNCLESLEFLSAMPALQELWIEGNGFQMSDKYVAVLLCPNLRLIDGKPVDRFRSFVCNCKNKYQAMIDDIWEAEIESRLTAVDMTRQFRATLSEDFIRSVRGRRCGVSVAAAFRDILTRSLCEEKIKQELDSASGHTASKRRRVEEIENFPQHLAINSPRKNVSIKSPERLRVEVTEIRSSPRKTAAVHRMTTTVACDVVEDYEPVKFIRCHFSDRKALRLGHTDNDPTDEITNVWACALEPDPQNKERTTGLVATCGGDSVCLIDCSSARVMKRFQQHKEQFYALAWTTLTLCNEVDQETRSGVKCERNENILAVGGINGHLRLLHPSQLVCYAESGSGRPNRAVVDFYYSCLVFHPTKPTWLFCGSSDTTITLFDIGIPAGPEYNVEIKKLLVLFTQPQVIVLNQLIFEVDGGKVSGGWGLLAGTEEGLMLWPSLGEVAPPNKSGVIKRVESDCQVFIIEKDRSQVDGLVLIDKQRAACKCVSRGCIYVIDLRGLTSKSRGRVMVEPLLILDWVKTDVDYIGLTYRNGLLGCGDDKGAIWLYNISTVLDDCKQKSVKSCFTLPASRVLKWPHCIIDSDRKEAELRMTDVLEKPEPLVINGLSISADCSYLVGVTDCNLVVVWRRMAA